MNVVNDVVNGFNQLTQLAFVFALGLAFSQANISVGWIFFWIVLWEFGVYLLFHSSQYYDPFFRIAYNCVFLLSILVGQYIYFGKTTFQDFLYPESEDCKKKSYKGEKYKVIENAEDMFDKFIEKEEKRNRKKKLKKLYNYFLN